MEEGEKTKRPLIEDDWEVWDSDEELENLSSDSDINDNDVKDVFLESQEQNLFSNNEDEQSLKETINENEKEKCTNDDVNDRKKEEQEEKFYIYMNTIPLIGALYGVARLAFYKRQHKPNLVRSSLWGICKNLLNSFTLAVGALLVPLNVRDLMAAAVATGILEGIVDTLLDYYQCTPSERWETTVEEMLHNVLNHAPILGTAYNIIRLLFFLHKRNKEEIKKSLWGLAANIVTTAITIISVIKFGLKATGSIPSGMARSCQAKVTFTLAKKGVTAPVCQVGKVLATKEAKKLKRRIKRELSLLKTKIKDVEPEKFLKRIGLAQDLQLEESDPRFHLRKRLKSFIDSKKS